MKNILIKFVQDSKTWDSVAAKGTILMKLANERGEIFGYCGGQLACTTCRVYIPKRYERLLPEPSEYELDALCELPNNPKYPEKDFTKRMSCQIKCEEKFHGLTIFIPPTLC
jgi:ferredoxin, 2Fe-2S